MILPVNIRFLLNLNRCNMRAYCVFSSLSFVIYCFPAHWINGHNGWLRQMGVVDIAGCGPVHIVGGTAAFVASWFLGPRIGLKEQVSPRLPDDKI